MQNMKNVVIIIGIGLVCKTVVSGMGTVETYFVALAHLHES
uniref:Uncharacterized protein n=1 Tax=Rhizophora mucronata TaxID=61149 RepID=A0A2P2NVW7_RHIMU